MARPHQYNFPPPPLPPGPPSSNIHVQQYGYPQQSAQYLQNQQRGGGTPRGGRRGSYGNRGDFHVTPPYNTHHSGSAYDPRHPQQGPPPGPPSGYSAPSRLPMSASYIGPQAVPLAQQNYPTTHWPNNQNVPQHNLVQQSPMQHPSQNAIPAQNYRPNFAPQNYQQPHYAPQHSPAYQPQPPSYGHSISPNQPSHIPPQIAPQQWQGSPQHNRPPFNNNRGRGAFNSSSRGSYDSPAPLMGPPIRMGFDNDRGGAHVAQARNSFSPSHINHQNPATFHQPPFQSSYQPPEYSQPGSHLSIESNPYTAPQRGRGGSANFRGKGRGDFHQTQIRNRSETRDHQSTSQNPTPEIPLKPTGLDTACKKKKKRKTNTLGLTPNGIEHEESDDEVDDVDEEARLVTLLGPDTPQLPRDLDAWLAERKSRFPTKARREAAAEQLRQRLRQINEVKPKKENGERAIKREESETKLEKQQRKAEKLRIELEKAERKIQQEISGFKRKRENGDEGDEDRDQASEDDSDSSSSSDSDSKPETLSSRANSSIRLPQTPKAQLQRHCKYFSTGGTCGKKGKCRFVHDQEVRNQALRDKEANGGKMTLAQRLILNDTAKDDLTILKSIKYLKEKGLMLDQLTGSTPLYDEDSRIKIEETSDTEMLSHTEN